MSDEKKMTPMMQQWEACKKQAKEALLLFRMGDFYEAFYEDAEILAREIELTLTKRQGIPMSGVPWHTADGYIDRLVSKGFRVAIAEQVEDPKTAKGLVKREVVRLITPGTVVNSSLLTEKNNNYIVSLTQVGATIGCALLDITTSEFKVIEFECEKELLNELYRLSPKECLTSKKFKEKHPSLFVNLPHVTTQEEWIFDHKMACSTLCAHFKVQHLDGFGLKGFIAGINAAGALLTYLKEDLVLAVEHIKTIAPYSMSRFLSLDAVTMLHLELIEGKNSLLSVIDRTKTPMGGRLLRQWLKRPLLTLSEIHERQEAIGTLVSNPFLLSELSISLQKIRDLERLMMKISSHFATPRDFVTLRLSLEEIPFLKQKIAPYLPKIAAEFVDIQKLTEELRDSLVDEPPLRVGDSPLFRDGFDSRLDELRHLTKDGKAWIASYQTQIKDESGIKNLKVSYNKIFGYYIEVSKAQSKMAPAHFERKQTLVNAERFTTAALKEYETKVLLSEERKNQIEIELFEKLKEAVVLESSKILKIASGVALLDTLYGLSETALKLAYVRPHIDGSQKLEIKEGRHPMVEAVISKEYFIANDTYLDGQREQLMLITGPNMGGKSTYIRQVALIVILAQMGSFVPAREAHMGIVDKIFTRIGAQDDLSRGQSTFMVEMSETATILNNATSKSLVILDEIGRGTSTYDGLAIAWAVSEYLLTTEGKKAKTLFATHYFELTDLEKTYPQVKNYHAALKEMKDDIVFLHKIRQGAADKSYGIQVARLAGLPLPVTVRALEILKSLEEKGTQKQGNEKKAIRLKREEQLSFF